ncbi:MAG: 4-hydroxybutyryl-CoA dehydratase [Spirochaetia bacterium]|mgnify:FL=1|jgi:4-hydroxybutyryl-CoA dehydratase/vinylacetyl-CoA-Delta-isomerase|uniref:4-hydroxybutyryl-CoA dehydratase/vinylacetyl-CoA-Delta-isomerase n=1 Tax=bioreactor metagenome TaxID=1076179 RepID=A0A644TU59_9ZZZZ|nr:4-hydroxybutyryl-CoA dehydratase [Spirochaetia bacterium]NLX45845.1 4-hydroxybutyryl-CoA dehydratase [Treponema sp.]VBB38911.1 4-hydroxybutyryl-CoA dehydratase/vinylacetyl-CoA-Delta-isomerase [uncultured Spirochaetota bacterium]HAP54937.1 4-hydroxybutyryl-CoA dehydratase [Spirochaetaceae bacterium]HOI23497.1 4-hydroxyphenylacetate 3-hydroxylase N-terminal domain-containing protein [Spirochaetales bacterium]
MAIKTKAEYIESLRKLQPVVYMFGERIDNFVDNPRIRAGIEATGETYALAESFEHRDAITTNSPLIGEKINRFTLPPASIEDLVARVKNNRLLGGRVGTCYQRCTGMDCLSALAIVTYDIDRKYGTTYNARFLEFLKYVQKNDLTCNAGVTDVKGDRSLNPAEQADKDLYLRVVEERKDGIVVRGAKAHQTGSLSSHEIIVLPTRALRKEDKEYAVAFALPIDTPGIIHVVGRSSLDMRELQGCDTGNTRYSKYCPTVIFDNVFVPWDRVFLYGETEFAGDLVMRFSSFHRQSHGGCKAGKIDCMIGAALNMMDYNGTTKAGHLRGKVIDMIHRSETLYGCSLAASYEGKKEPSGTYFVDPVLVNASKLHEGKEMAEVSRLLMDIAGGFVSDLPSDKDFENPTIGPLLKKYLKGTADTPVEDRVKMLRLVEKITLESADSVSDIHGGGSPEAHRITIMRESKVGDKKALSKRLAGIEE